MGGHERPCKLVPSFGIKGYGFHDRFLTVTDFGGLGFELGIKSFLVSWLFDVMKRIGTKMVHVCEGAVRYPAEWSQVGDPVVC